MMYVHDLVRSDKLSFIIQLFQSFLRYGPEFGAQTVIEQLAMLLMGYMV